MKKNSRFPWYRIAWNMLFLPFIFLAAGCLFIAGLGTGGWHQAKEWASDAIR